MPNPKKKKSKDRFWTSKEIQLITHWQETGVSGKEQAKRLGRNYHSWKSAVQRYNIHGEVTNNYNPDLRAFIMRMIGLGLTQAAIAKMKGHKTHTLVGKIVREMTARGLLERVKHGTYKVTKEWGDDAP